MFLYVNHRVVGECTGGGVVGMVPAGVNWGTEVREGKLKCENGRVRLGFGPHCAAERKRAGHCCKLKIVLLLEFYIAPF